MKVNVPILKFLLIFNVLFVITLSFLIVSIEYDGAVFPVVENGVVEVIGKVAANLMFPTSD